MDVYARLESATGFDWDAGNESKNRDKHGVSAAECEQVFFNLPLVATASDRGDAEQRYYVLGRSDAGRKLFVVLSIRDDLIRVISARDMSRRERAAYDRHL